jgi:hypothetical protein
MNPLTASNLELLYGMLFVLVCAIGFGYLYFRLNRMVRQKGHQSPWRTTLFTLSYVSGLALGFFADGRDPASCYSCSPAANPEYFQEALIWPHTWRFVSNFFPAIVVVFVVAAVAAKLMPAGKRRVGARRSSVPWQFLGQLAVAAGCIGLAVGWYYDVGYSALFKIGVTSAAFRGIFAYNARRFSAPSLTTVLEEDSRSPVFYLRAFDQEDTMFTAVSLDQLESLQIPVRNPQAFLHAVTLEEFFAVVIRSQVGPFIALGDPNDAIPPGGASRDYIDDTTWQDKFGGLAKRSTFILMGPERSANLSWELSYIRANNLQRKLFIVTAPPLTSFFQRITWGINRTKKIWPEFALAANQALLRVGDYPGSGAVLNFDSNGEPVVIATNMKTPEDYIWAINTYFNSSASAATGD